MVRSRRLFAKPAGTAASRLRWFVLGGGGLGISTDISCHAKKLCEGMALSERLLKLEG
jgi:hypothetical protein